MSALTAFFLKILETEDIGVAKAWPLMAVCSVLFVTLCTVIVLCASSGRSRHYHTYDDIYAKDELDEASDKGRILLQRTVIVISVFFTLMYIIWRIRFSVPVKEGWVAVTGNLLLLAVEILGFFESLILYRNLMGLRNHPVPVIEDDEYPDVDIFIATYNEPCDLLRKTINGLTAKTL